jgi:lipoprotein
VKNFPILGRKFLFFSQFPTPFLGGFFSFSGCAFGEHVDAEKITPGQTKNRLTDKKNPLPWNANRILGERG